MHPAVKYFIVYFVLDLHFPDAEFYSYKVLIVCCHWWLEEEIE